MKLCSKCGLEKPDSAFYPQRNPSCLQTLCKPCHNAACVARRRASPAYRQRQYQAKQRWNQRHPDKVNIHLRRFHRQLIWDPRLPDVPDPCREAEAALWRLREAISA